MAQKREKHAVPTDRHIAWRNRMKAKGFVTSLVWVPKERRPEVVEFARKMREEAAA